MKFTPFDVPPAVVTATLTMPAVEEAGDTAVIDVFDTTVTLVAASDPNDTLAPVMKPEPVIVTVVPPAVEPEVGAIVVIVGAGAE